MLAVSIRPDGGLLIEATERELRDLAAHLLRAAVLGRADPGFVSDVAVTTVEIVRVDE